MSRRRQLIGFFCIAWLFDVAAASSVLASQLASQLGPRVASLSGQGGPARRYRVGRYVPLISEPNANCHAVALRARPDTLDVIHRWEHTGEYDLSPVPWRDILEKKVSYSLSSMYGGARQPKSPADEASCPATLLPPAPDTSSDLPPRCRLLPSGDTLVGHRAALRLVSADNKVLWSIELPRGHTLIDVVPHEGLLFIATRSNQGARDGELQLPYLTTQIFAVRSPAR